jgi:hypothetical protein
MTNLSQASTMDGSIVLPYYTGAQLYSCISSLPLKRIDEDEYSALSYTIGDLKKIIR